MRPSTTPVRDELGGLLDGFNRDLDQWESGEHPTGSRGRIGSRIPHAGNIATVDAHNVLIGVSQRLGALATLGPPSREAYEQLLDQMVG